MAENNEKDVDRDTSEPGHKCNECPDDGSRCRYAPMSRGQIELYETGLGL